MEDPVETCRRYLEEREFLLVRFIVAMNRLLQNNRSEFDQIKAISDVLIAAENPLPNGAVDYYKMLRMSRSKPVVLENFKKLMKLLDGSEKEAAQAALQAWSVLSKSHLETKHDRELMLHEKKKKKEKEKTTMGCGNGRWKPSEDLKLRELVTELGPRNWKCIAEKIPGRTDNAVKNRWRILTRKLKKQSAEARNTVVETSRSQGL